jgi:hypothetical protein
MNFTRAAKPGTSRRFDSAMRWRSWLHLLGNQNALNPFPLCGYAATRLRLINEAQVTQPSTTSASEAAECRGEFF